MSRENLKKTIGLTGIFCISAGAMISSGIFILPGVAFAHVGPAVFIAYGLAGICALLGSLATIELATAMPLAGGIYFFTGRSLGPLAGTVSGLLNWGAIVLKSAFAIFGMSELMFLLLGWDPHLTGITLTVLFLGINLIGAREAAWAQIIMVILLFAAMGAYIILGAPNMELSRFSPFLKPGTGLRSLFAEAAFVFVAFGGLLDVASVAEEVKNPRRSLPWGMITGVIAVTVIYVLTLIVTVGALPPEKLSGSLTPLADTAKVYYGQAGFAVITLGAMMAFVTTANAGLMSAARFPFAMSRDKLIPAVFARTFGARQMPLPALLLTGAAMLVVQWLPLEKLVTMASTVIMLSFILTNLSVIILRESKIQNYRPSFEMPFYPLTPILSMVLFGLLILELGLGSVQLCFITLFAGIILYFLFGRKVNLESALVHLVSRIARKRLRSHGLERELREIIRARDGIVADTFDQIVEEAQVILVEMPMGFPELVRRVCLARKAPLSLSDDELIEQLVAREKDSSTTLTPTIAVPHLTVPGKDHFELVIVKSVPGVYFHAEAEAVKTIIFLFGSPNRRNLHLKTLAAIAQIIQSPSFEKRWNQAKNPENLRDLLLLSKRKRAQEKH